MNSVFFLRSGLFLLFLGVATGAFGAHGLKQIVTESQAQTWQTATEYLFYHALGLVGLGIWAEHKKRNRLITVSGISLLTGVVLFSGSLYLLVITDIRQLGMITPLGGLLFLLGWLCWLLAAIKHKSA